MRTKRRLIIQSVLHLSRHVELEGLALQGGPCCNPYGSRIQDHHLQGDHISLPDTKIQFSLDTCKMQFDRLLHVFNQGMAPDVSQEGSPVKAIHLQGGGGCRAGRPMQKDGACFGSGRDHR
jgi:hypothetical protein